MIVEHAFLPAIPIERVLIAGSFLLALSIIASKATARLGVPALLVFLIVGMMAGSAGLGGIHFDDPQLAQSFGVVALVFILFSGGLDTAWSSIRPILWHSLLLSTLGVLLTCILVGLFASALFHFSLTEGLLLGAIISSTDAAAVFAVLSSKKVSLKGRLKPLLEFESGSNDPMAVFLTVSILGLITGEKHSFAALIPSFFQQMVLGASLGFFAANGMKLLLNWIKLEYEGLYPVLTISLILLLYGITQILGGNGFLAVYVGGLVLGHGNFLHKRSLSLFHDGLAWLMQIVMFLTLGLLVSPSKLLSVAGIGLLLSSFLIFAARPLATYLTMIGTPYNLKEKTMISWVGLRGAVPIILATYPLLAGIPRADIYFNLVFFIVLTSILIQGTSIPRVARWLGVAAPFKEKFRYPLEFVPTGNMKSNLVEVEVSGASSVVGKTLVQIGFPSGALVVLIQRTGDVFIPRGSTQLKAGDTLLVLANSDSLTEVRKTVQEPVLT